MSGTTEIIDALAKLLCEGLPQLKRIYTDLTPEGFLRPSALIQSISTGFSTANRRVVEKTAYFTITLFDETDDYSNSSMARLLDWQQWTLELFLPGCLPVGGRMLPVQASTGGRDWGKAYVDLQLTYYDDRGVPDPVEPPMETIETNMKVRG